MGNTEQLCDYAQFDFVKLCQIAMNFIPYLEECFEVMDTKYLIDILNGRQYSSYSRDSYTVQKTEVSLEEEIEFRTYVKKLNSEEKYLKNKYE